MPSIFFVRVRTKMHGFPFQSPAPAAGEQASRRSRIWEPEAKVIPGTLPPLAQMLRTQIEAIGGSVDSVGRRIGNDYEENLY
jgi:hypothetical protein